MYWRNRNVDLFPCARTANSWNSRYAGKETAQFKNGWGYQLISILGVKHIAHRVVWAMCHGEWPDGEIDHINRNPSDNRIENLRIATATENARNKGDYANNKSGYRGVTWHKSSSKWMAQIKVFKKNIHLGLFNDPAEAGAAYQAAREKYFGGQ